MCAKIKTKKAKLDFAQSIKAILEAHSIYLDASVLDPLVHDMEFYFNSVYKPDDTVMFFPELVKQYMDLFEEITEGERASFNAIMAINLKRLTKILMHRFLIKNPTGIWDKESCLNQHYLYYQSILSIPFMRQNFTPTMMYSRHNENITYLSSKKKDNDAIEKKILGI